jgi:acetyltransferase-like isoleucine patch superfamily enzyme
VTDLRSYVFKRETKLARSMFSMLKGMARWECPVIPGVHHLLYAERKARRGLLRAIGSKFYYAPLLRMSCTEVGKGLILYEDMPKLLGSLDIRIGSRVTLSGAQVWMSGGPGRKNQILIGDDSYLGHAVQVISGSRVSIGRHVLIANRVVLNGYSGHPLDPLRRARGEAPDADGAAPISIGDYVWIGNDVTVLPGVTIGRGAVVATGAVVTKDVPELTVVAGIPAKPVSTVPVPPEWQHSAGGGAPAA